MEQVLYFLVFATGLSFVWMLISGYRPQGERLVVGAFHLFGLVILTAISYYLWRRDLGMSLLLASGYGFLSVILWIALPDWNTRAHAFFAAFASAQILFLGRVAWTIAFGGLSGGVIVGSLVLFAAELLVVLLTLYFAYEVLDVMCRLRWHRFFPPFAGPNDYWPKVSVHVPAHAEPPDMVIETLTALRDLDYPSYEVIMVDDNTKDDELWRPVLEYCHRSGIKVFHLQNYPGFKSGALNFALTQTAPDAEVIAVVDSDYLVKPNFLRETVPYFRNPRAFVQTPQSFRNTDANLFAHFSALAQRFFFEISMRSRNEENAIIFCGTMGLIRKRVLERIGGWDEWCITEDAEASLRILRKGYQSVYINRIYGNGLLPTSFEDTKKQRFRAAKTGTTERLTFRQRLAYLMGLLGWLNDLLVLIFTGFLVLTAIAFVQNWQLPVRQLTEMILLIPVLSIVTGILRVAWALRVSTGCTWRDGAGAFAAMLSLSWTVARACLAALWNDKGTFLRTSKFPATSDLTRALRAATWEALVGIGLVAMIPMVLNVRSDREGLLLGLLLGWHALVYLSSLRSALVESLPAESAHEEPVTAVSG